MGRLRGENYAWVDALGTDGCAAGSIADPGEAGIETAGIHDAGGMSNYRRAR